MFYNQVVFKLWITIIGLVTVVLMVLSLTLMQFLDGFYQEQRTEDLQDLGSKLSGVLQTYGDQEEALSIASDLIGSSTRLLIISPNGELIRSSVSPDSRVPLLIPEELSEDQELRKAFQGKNGVSRNFYSAKTAIGTTYKDEYLVVSYPVPAKNQTNALILYMQLNDLHEPTNRAAWVIFAAAVIGFILTTFFAFFLSSRITKPLSAMKKAADRYSRGDFSVDIKIKSNDEIGVLADTFNKMAKRLGDLIVALSREKEQISSVLSSMVDGVITLDKDGKIIVTNPPAEGMLKAWWYEQGGEGEQDENLPNSILSIFQEVVKNEQEVIADVVVQGRTFSVVMAPLYDRDQVRGAVAVMRDMTEERTLDKLRKDFVANVSHELRTPLVMLQGYSEAIMDDIAESQEEKRELAHIIYDESLRMSRLVNELLDLARLEGGHFNLNLTPSSLLTLENKVVHKFNGIAKDSEIHLELDWKAKEEEFCFDSDRLEQVLTNLIDNAIRHTQKGGQVTLKTEDDDQYCTIEVTDTGSGIPPEDLPFVFERFYKGDKARTRGRSGTGLGLSIAKNIVTAHGGKINVRSKLNEGTTFSIRLPKRFDCYEN